MIKVLLVDDDESLRQFLVYKLKQDFGFATDEACSGFSAIDLLKRGEKYSLIISDYNMPNGNGADLQNYLVENNIQSFFFFYTSEAQVEVNYSHQKFISVIQKPDIEQLLTELVLKICALNSKKNELAF